MNNESAIEFYKKFGFEIVETKEHYYKRIEPADAHVLQKDLKKTSVSQSASITVSSALTSATNTTSSTTTINCHPPQSNGYDTHIHSQQVGGKSKA